MGRQGLVYTFFFLYHKVEFQLDVASAKNLLKNCQRCCGVRVELGANCQTCESYVRTSLPIRLSVAIYHILFIVWTIVKEPTYHEYNKDSAHHMC
jgi:hypothetical protein